MGTHVLRLVRSRSMTIALAATALLAAAAVVAVTTVPAPVRAAPETLTVAELRMALRGLLVDHIVWSRASVVATRLGERAAARVAEERALQNARAIGQAIAPFYGTDAAAKFGTLFTGHVQAVQDRLSATLAGSEARRKAADDRAGRNADEIAAFLAGANPHLPRATVRSLLVAHYGHHIGQIEAVAQRDWAREARVWEEMVKHIYTIADALAEGIAKQFPDRVQ
ncbi:MAG: hypothetical protein QN158_05505 [Armatimonadota bacterium]|nr:hypothetical protein [Armatimonadota bacterium]MDR7592830.1 hypothetical protein [Armatimonadota bacterium]